MNERKFDVGFKPVVYFHLMPDEIAKLMECAKCHYDGTCRSIAIPGRGAFLYAASMNDGHFSVTSPVQGRRDASTKRGPQ